MTDEADPAERSTRRGLPPVQPREPGTTPTFLVVSGVITLAVGMVVSIGGGAFSVLGAIVGVLGSVITAIGVVAAGVRLGTEWADYDRAMRER